MQPVSRLACCQVTASGAASGQANLSLGPPGQCVVLPAGRLLTPVSSAASGLADLGRGLLGLGLQGLYAVLPTGWLACPCATSGQASMKLGFWGMVWLRAAVIVWAMHEGC